MKRTALLLVRLPKARRPRERPWEIFNTRDFGFSEGNQNYSMWLLMCLISLGLIGYEGYNYAQRILARGDTCPACESARAHYRERVKNKEFEIHEALRRGRTD